METCRHRGLELALEQALELVPVPVLALELELEPELELELELVLVLVLEPVQVSWRRFARPSAGLDS